MHTKVASTEFLPLALELYRAVMMEVECQAGDAAGPCAVQPPQEAVRPAPCSRNMHGELVCVKQLSTGPF